MLSQMKIMMNTLLKHLEMMKCALKMYGFCQYQSLHRGMSFMSGTIFTPEQIST